MMKVYQVRKEILRRLVALGEATSKMTGEDALGAQPLLTAEVALNLARLNELESLLEWVREKDGMDDA